MKEFLQRTDWLLQFGTVQRNPVFHGFVGAGILVCLALRLCEQPRQPLFIVAVGIADPQFVPPSNGQQPLGSDMMAGGYVEILQFFNPGGLRQPLIVQGSPLQKQVFQRKVF